MDHANPYRNIDEHDESLRAPARRDSAQLALGLGPSKVRSEVTQPVSGPAIEATSRSPAHLALFRSGNPYATHFYLPDVEPDAASAATATLTAKSVDSAVPGLSQNAFRRLCIGIFRAYMPNLEQGKLRPHHREFIARNESRSASVRRALVSELQKYDLASIPGLVPQFNREDDVFTDAKLRRIEEVVGHRSSE